MGWLLVLDNVPHPGHIAGLLGRALAGQAQVTSQRPGVQRRARFAQCGVDGEEGAQQFGQGVGIGRRCTG
ncbi:hypothetical protein [Acrocarpospora pleiomorpha]|uniref:hypothetical protein n=1 Tax=Acrocarpospora pleiomorpha TaxID=90975 RepID=UPI0012D36924|nr:hypothetical protein [Acrocarpospora pleiomorpha]